MGGHFHRDKQRKKFCAKLDIRKAYDSVPWDAVLTSLASLAFALFLHFLLALPFFHYPTFRTTKDILVITFLFKLKGGA